MTREFESLVTFRTLTMFLVASGSGKKAMNRTQEAMPSLSWRKECRKQTLAITLTV